MRCPFDQVPECITCPLMARRRARKERLLVFHAVVIVGLVVQVIVSSPRPSFPRGAPYHRDGSRIPRSAPELARGALSKPYFSEYPFDETTLDKLSSQIAIEAEGCSLEHKMMVAQCILDRTETRTCSDGTVYGTLTRPGQFEYRSGYYIEKDVYEAIDRVFRDGERVTSERCIWFCNPSRLPENTRNWFYKHRVIYEADGNVFFSDEEVR